MKSRAYIIEWDNEQSYEDHRTLVIGVVMDKSAAEQEAEKLNAWIKRKREQAPEDPNLELPDEEYARLLEKRISWIKALRAPLGEDCMRDSVSHNCGVVRTYPVTLIT